MKTYFCWRCRQDMPFLEEDEWQKIKPLLHNAIEEIKEYRREHNCGINEARFSIKQDASEMFEELTGMPDVHFEIIFHHRLKNWEKECDGCRHLLRSPRASFCANCGKASEQITKN